MRVIVIIIRVKIFLLFTFVFRTQLAAAVNCNTGDTDAVVACLYGKTAAELANALPLNQVCIS